MSGFTLFLKRALSSVTPDPIYSSPHQLDTCVCSALLYSWCSLSSWAKNIRSCYKECPVPTWAKRAILVACCLTGVKYYSNANKYVSGVCIKRNVYVKTIPRLQITIHSSGDNEEEVGVDNDVWGEEGGFNIEFPCQPHSALTARTSSGQCVNAKSFQPQFCLSMSFSRR